MPLQRELPLRDAEFAGWLVGSIRSGLVAIDARARIAALNGEAHRLLGGSEASPAGALGRDCREVLTEHPEVAHLLVEALDAHEPRSRAELTLRSSGGGEGPTIGYTLGPICDASGLVRGAVLQFRDLTPYERAEEQERLRERLAALGEMAAGLAHEIRNPLAGMEIMLGLLRRRLGEQPDELALLDELKAELGRVAQAVTDGLEFVRPVELRHESVDPVEILEEALARARARIPYRGAVERDYAESVPRLQADGDGIQGVLTNLIVNAFEAMEADRGASGRVRLGLHLASDPEPEPAGSDVELVFSIADSGPGIPPELRQRVFYPFFTTKPRGSGVGLANAQKVVAGHGGRIELESEPGRGTLFRVRLPVNPRVAA